MLPEAELHAVCRALREVLTGDHAVGRVIDEQNLLRPNLRIFVNGIGVRELQHALQPDDFVAVVLALSGG